MTSDMHVNSAPDSFGHRSLNNHTRKQGGLESLNRRVISRTEQQEPKRLDYTGRYRLELDSRADTTCCGKGFVPISEIDQVCNIAGFHPNMPVIKDVSIRTCACAYDSPAGEALILLFGQALYFGEEMEHLLLSPNQVQSYAHDLCLNPKQYTNGTSIHGIHSEAENFTLPFLMRGGISYIPI
jgi:hypothetical protein